MFASNLKPSKFCFVSFVLAMERRSEKRANWLEYQVETMPLPAEWEELYDVKPQDLDTDPDIPKRT